MHLNKSGVYKINFSNGKCYIGMSCNISRRMREHRASIDVDSPMPVHSAMSKHTYTLEILEEEIDRIKLQELEIKWIKKYKSNDKQFGYNLTAGGDGSGSGTDNHQAKFDEKTIKEVYDDLLNNCEIYIYELAEKYKISPDAMSEINTGVRYFNSAFDYPLREPPKVISKSGTEHHNAKLDKKSLTSVKELLISSDLTLEEIAKAKNCCYVTISKINRGISYFDENDDYPIRKERKKTSALNDKEISEVRNLLMNSKQTIVSISEDYGVSKDTIYRLNRGKTYFDKDLEYPLRAKRSNKKAVSTILESEE